MKLPVLLKDECWSKHYNKLKEEHHELQQAIIGLSQAQEIFDIETCKENIAEEAIDVIQVCIGILDKLETEEPGMVKTAILKHNKKIIDRGWSFKKILQVTED